MREGDFELQVVGAREAEEEDVVRLDHGQVYSLALISFSAEHYEVILKIDGQELGLYDLPAGKTIQVHEGAQGVLRFFREGSTEARTKGRHFTHTTGWVMALFVPALKTVIDEAAKVESSLVAEPAADYPKLSDHADPSIYNLDASVCLEVLMEPEPTPRTAGAGSVGPPSVQSLRASVQVAIQDFDFGRAMDLLLLLVDRQEEDHRQEIQEVRERLADLEEGQVPTPAQATAAQPVVKPAAALKIDPPVSTEGMVRFQRAFEADLINLLWWASGLKPAGLEMLLAKLVDKLRHLSEPMDLGAERIRYSVLVSYKQLRQSKKRQRGFWPRFLVWAKHISFPGTLDDVLILEVLESPITKHPGNLSPPFTEDELERMVGALAP